MTLLESLLMELPKMVLTSKETICNFWNLTFFNPVIISRCCDKELDGCFINTITFYPQSSLDIIQKFAYADEKKKSPSPLFCLPPKLTAEWSVTYIESKVFENKKSEVFLIGWEQLICIQLGFKNKERVWVYINSAQSFVWYKFAKLPRTV